MGFTLGGNTMIGFGDKEQWYNAHAKEAFIDLLAFQNGEVDVDAAGGFQYALLLRLEWMENALDRGVDEEWYGRFPIRPREDARARVERNLAHLYRSSVGLILEAHLYVNAAQSSQQDD